MEKLLLTLTFCSVLTCLLVGSLATPAISAPPYIYKYRPFSPPSSDTPIEVIAWLPDHAKKELLWIFVYGLAGFPNYNSFIEMNLNNPTYPIWTGSNYPIINGKLYREQIYILFYPWSPTLPAEYIDPEHPYPYLLVNYQISPYPHGGMPSKSVEGWMSFGSYE